MPYSARRIDPNHYQNLGDFSIARTYTKNGYEENQIYHYNSKTGSLINRSAWYMPTITHGSRIYNGCMKAIGRLLAEEEA